jgi:hypothetical protein
MNNRVQIEGINIDNIDEYNAKCDIIKKIIKSQYKNSSIKFTQLNKIDLVYVLIDGRIKFAIMPDVKWTELREEIDLKLRSVYKDKMCVKCGCEMKCAAGCNKCRAQTCLECYIDNFKLNKGIVRCGICNYSFGVRVPDEYIDLAIDDIRSNAKLK